MQVPAVSIILPTTQSWPAVAASLESLLNQDADCELEILLVDGHGSALGEVPDPRVRWLRFPGSDTFALRAEGIAAARGRVVAITEDHCLAPRGWVAAMVAAHDADAAVALVGATTNHPDSAVDAIDRANFLLTFAGQTSHRLRISRRRLPVPTNLSFKREALRGDVLPAGVFEYEWLAQLRDRGVLGVTDAVVLHHRQCWGSAAPGVHWASGRSYGATVRGWSWRDRLAWWLSVPLLQVRIGALVLPDLLSGAGGGPATLADVAYVALLIAANVCGQVQGVLCGAGASRHRL